MLVCQGLTPESFLPFGRVTSLGTASESVSTNLGTARRWDFTATLENTRPEARPNLAVFRSEPRPFPFVTTLLERHPCSTQTFIPMEGEHYVVLAAPSRANGEPDVEGLRGFVGRRGQAITYARGTWHHPILAVHVPALLVMLAWEDGGALDCEERHIGAVSIHLPPQLSGYPVECSPVETP